MYYNETPDTIKARILEKITKLDTQQGSFTDDMAGPLAYELFLMYSELNTIPSRVWPDETGGPYLDLKAREIGLARKQGAKAEVMLEITGTPGYKIPATTAFLTEDNLYFETLEEAAVPDEGIVTTTAIAQGIGSQYNVAADSIIIPFTDDSRLEKVTNPAPASGGAEEEGDSSFYRRIDQYRKRPGTSGNKYDYEYWALMVDGVEYATCFPLWNGNGTVKVLIAGENHLPVDDTIIDRCNRLIEEKRPIGPQVTVVTTTLQPVTVTAMVHLTEASDLKKIEQEFRDLLQQTLAPTSLKYQTVIYHWIAGAVIGLSGVIDYTDLLVNGADRDISLTPEQVPVLEDVEFYEAI